MLARPANGPLDTAIIPRRGSERIFSVIYRVKVILLTFLLLNVLAFVAISTSGDVNTLPGNQACPSADIGPDGTIYVVYQDNRSGDYDLYLAKSTDGGMTFGDPAGHILMYDDGAATTFQGQPSIDVDSSGTIHIAFVAAMAYILYYTYSTDGGLTFSPLEMVSDAPPGTQNVAQYPSVRVDDISGHIYIAWRDQRTGVPKACYSVGTPGEEGITFSENRYLHGDPASSVRQKHRQPLYWGTEQHSGFLLARPISSPMD